MKEIYVNFIAARLSIKSWQVENCVELFADGATIPFVSRYRKERTGGLDEVDVAEVKHWNDVFDDMEKRKSTILETIDAAGALTEELKGAIEKCTDANELEDLYLPYRPKRRTRATVAREAGLEPLADQMWEIKLRDPLSEARKYVGEKVADEETALGMARDIVAERLSEMPAVREALRRIFLSCRLCSSRTKNADSLPEAAKYRSWFDFSMPLPKIAPHQLLAILRAENEGVLSVKIAADATACGKKIYYEFSKGKPWPSEELRAHLNMAVDDAFKRLLEPSISGEVLKF